MQYRRGHHDPARASSPEVVGLPGVHIEVKRTERLNLRDALEKATREAGADVPIVLHRQNRTSWMVTVALEVIPRLALAVMALPVKQAQLPMNGIKQTER